MNHLRPVRAHVTVSFVLAVCLLLLLVLVQSWPEVAGSRYGGRPPNIVLILADDLGYADLGCYGGQVARTPSLDRLAGEGVRLTDFHSAATVCFPSRTGLLTGRYQRRAGVSNNAYPGYHDGIGPQTTAFPKLLQHAGFRTGLFGKWHQGKRPQNHPFENGFDEFVGFLGGSIDHHSHIDILGRHDWWHGRENTPEAGHSTELITSHSVEFLRKHKEEPFFLMVSYAAPHWPYQRKYDPAVRKLGEPEAPAGWQSHIERYPEIIGEIDSSVEQILDEIDSLGLTGDTIVVFTADNGAQWIDGSRGSIGSARPFRGSKSNILEGGHRVPCLVRWPGFIKPGESAELLNALDLAPTFLDAADIQLPRELTLDGRSLLPHFKTGQRPPARPFYWEYFGHPRFHARDRAIRFGDWKLHFTDGRKVRLYNLARDPAEHRNRARSEPEKVAELRTLWEVWFRDISPPSGPDFEVRSEEVWLSNGLPIERYRPVGRERCSGMVLLFEDRGWGDWPKDVATRLASTGMIVLTVDLQMGRQQKKDWVDPLVGEMVRMESDKDVKAGWGTFALGGGGHLARRLSQKHELKGMVFYEAELSQRPEVPSLALYSGTAHAALNDRRDLPVSVEIVLFEDAPFGFLNPGNSRTFRSQDAREAWGAIEEFIKLRVPGG